jgi:hypothetical protein
MHCKSRLSPRGVIGHVCIVLKCVICMVIQPYGISRTCAFPGSQGVLHHGENWICSEMGRSFAKTLSHRQREMDLIAERFRGDRWYIYRMNGG